MLHKLALASNGQSPLVKEAIPSPDAQRQIARDLELKARYMGRARGHKMPKMPAPQPRGPLFKHVEGPAYQSYGGLLRDIPERQVQDIRMGKPTEKATAAFKKSPALIEKEIQKAHGRVAQSPMRQLRHRTLGKAKGWWGGRGLLGGKWRNRLALLGGAGALGAGIKAYLDANKTPQPELAPPVPQEQPAEGPQYLTYEDLYGYDYGYPKMSSSKYSPDAVTIPKPTSLPKVNPLGPGVSSTPTLKPDGAGSPLAAAEPSESTSKSAGLLKRSDAGVLPLLGLGAGGLGGWALGQKVISPILESEEGRLASRMKALQKVRKAAPMGAAAAGALLLAALTAAFAKRQARGIPTRMAAYDQTNAGFMPENSMQLGQFYG